MVVWSVLVLAMALMVKGAVPDPPTGITTVGSLKLGIAEDCTGVVAFSATQGTPNDLGKIIFADTLVDRGVGYSAQSGIYTTHCPGLYQFSFAGYGSSDLRLTLKKKPNNSNSWRPIVSIGPGGGANFVLLDLEAGDWVAVMIDSGKVNDGVTFSGHRIAKK